MADCIHPQLHPGRFDGSHSICFQCGHEVMIVIAAPLDGKTPQQRAREAWERCQTDITTYGEQPELKE